MTRVLAMGSVVLLLVATLLAEQPQETRLALDQLIDTNGTRFDGLVLKDDTQQVQFRYLKRRPGVRTLTFDVVFDRSEIASLVKAPEPGRTEAVRFFEALEKARGTEEEAARRLRLETAPWVTGASTAFLYRGPFFELQSDAAEPFVRLVCVRLNDIFAAYHRTLQPRVTAPRPTRIILFRSLAGFHAWQLQRGIKLLNPAVYDAKANEITVGCDLERLAKLSADYRLKHDRQLKELADRRVALDKHFQGKPPPAQLAQLRQYRAQLLQLNADNVQEYTRLEAAFFATLYHEAFHAYLDNAVYPMSQYEVPRWLNEGLAQLFEYAFVEIGELRVGRVDEKRLKDIQENLRRGRALTLREILQAPPEQFLVRHTSDQFEADRQYDAALALAHFLMMARHVPQDRLTAYVSRHQNGQEIAAFETLVGLRIDDCEKQWRDYVLRLRVDGTLRPGS